MIGQPRQRQPIDCAAMATLKAQQPATNTNSRRSSATRELYLTKYYFYRHAETITSDQRLVDTPTPQQQQTTTNDADDERTDVENTYRQVTAGNAKPATRCVSHLELEGFGAAAKVGARCLACQTAAAAAAASAVAPPQRTCELAQLAGSTGESRAPTSGGGGGGGNHLLLTNAATSTSCTNHSDNSSLVSASTTTVSPSNSTSQQHSITAATDQLTCNSGFISRCSTQISSASNNSLTTTDHNHNQQQVNSSYQRQPNLHLHNHSHLNQQLSFPAPNQRNSRLTSGRRNSSPNSETAAAAQQQHQPTIEEQLKRLLELGEPNEETKIQQQSPTALSSRCAPGTGSGQQQQQRSVQSTIDMKKSSGTGKLGGGRDDDQQRNARNQQHSSNMSPDDRLMIFMLASRSSSTNSAVERNARILKWLNNCKNAG